MAHVIFLHGASSSGKTTLARLVQQKIERPFWHVSLDHLRDNGVIPYQQYKSGAFDWSADRAAIFKGFHRSIAAYADAGNNLILDHILDTPGWAGELREILKTHDVLFVALHCSVPVLAARERARGDRREGSAAQDQASIHLGRRYDLELNAEDHVEHNVQAILDAWRDQKRCSEFSC